VKPARWPFFPPQPFGPRSSGAPLHRARRRSGLGRFPGKPRWGSAGVADDFASAGLGVLGPTRRAPWLWSWPGRNGRSRARARRDCQASPGSGHREKGARRRWVPAVCPFFLVPAPSPDPFSGFGVPGRLGDQGRRSPPIFCPGQVQDHPRLSHSVKWAWLSMKPGMAVRPARSITGWRRRCKA